MKNISYYILPILMLALAACSGESAGEPSDTVELDLMPPTIEAGAESRAKPINGTTFPYRSTIDYGQDMPSTDYYMNYSLGSFVCEKGTFNPHIVGANNQIVTFRSYYSYRSGTVSYSWPEGTPRLRIGRDIDVYTYYPRVSGSFKPDSVPFTTNQQYDWMWADPVTIDNVSSTNRTAPVRFHHAMTCVEIRLSTLYSGTLNIYNITLKDAKSKLVSSGYMNIIDGSLKYTADKSQIVITAYYHWDSGYEIVPKHNESNSSYRSFCFLMPEKDFEAGDLVLSFKFDNVAGRVDFTIPTTFKDGDGNDITVTKFETGKRYILNLLIDNTTLIYPLNFVVDDWTGVDVNLKI